MFQTWTPKKPPPRDWGIDGVNYAIHFVEGVLTSVSFIVGMVYDIPILWSMSLSFTAHVLRLSDRRELGQGGHSRPRPVRFHARMGSPGVCGAEHMALVPSPCREDQRILRFLSSQVLWV